LFSWLDSPASAEAALFTAKMMARLKPCLEDPWLIEAKQENPRVHPSQVAEVVFVFTLYLYFIKLSSFTTPS
jgi:hypothetical protein